jgi:Tfp pilus assembly protein PilV
VNHVETKQGGLSLVEVLFGSSIILIFVVALVGVHNFYIKVSAQSADTSKALLLAEESIEGVKFLRDSSWTNNIASLGFDPTYYLTYSTTTNTWQLSTAYSLIDGRFDRSIKVQVVRRDSSGRIVSSGGIADPNSRLITTSVSWRGRGATTTKSIATYITNIHDN